MVKNKSSCYKLEKYEELIFVTLSNRFFFLQREKGKAWDFFQLVFLCED